MSTPRKSSCATRRFMDRVANRPSSGLVETPQPLPLPRHLILWYFTSSRPVVCAIGSTQWTSSLAGKISGQSGARHSQMSLTEDAEVEEFEEVSHAWQTDPEP